MMQTQSICNTHLSYSRDCGSRLHKQEASTCWHYIHSPISLCWNLHLLPNPQKDGLPTLLLPCEMSNLIHSVFYSPITFIFSFSNYFFYQCSITPIYLFAFLPGYIVSHEFLGQLISLSLALISRF